MTEKTKILICGILPPPLFGHSAMYKILMESSFVETFDITFLDMKFWTYGQHKKVTIVKLLKMVKYFFQYLTWIIFKRPRYVLYNMSFDKMPFLKDFLFCFVGRTLGCGIVLHDMGQYVRELYNSSGKIYQALIRWLLKNATACILLGGNTKLVYEGFIDPKRLLVVPGSVEDSADITVKKEAKTTEEVTVLYFSFMSESKGVFTAFQAAEKVLKNNPSVRLVFAGPIISSTVQEGFDRLHGQFGSRVESSGYIGDIIERTRIFRNADVFIFPTHRDVFGLVLLHAMAEGLPVVASLEGCIPEIIENNVNGFLVSKKDAGALADAIVRLAENSSLRKVMGEANRRRYEEIYSPEHYGANMIRTFDEINRLN